MGKRFQAIVLMVLLVMSLMGCAGKSTRGTSGDQQTAQALVDEAGTVLERILDGDRNETLNKLITQSKGIMIIPEIGDVSLIFSIGGGRAIVLANTDVGWSGPVFLSKGTVGFGAQAGVSRQSGLMLFMHEDDVKYLMQTGAVLQGQARATILSSDYKANETPEFYESGDVYFFGEKTGLYLGIAIDGGGFSDRVKLNEAYSGVEGGGPRAILYEDKKQPAGAQKLRDLLDRAKSNYESAEHAADGRAK